jgi:putative heme-binding domain-containing protein
VHAFHVRQLLQFKNEELAARIRDVWGEIRESSTDRQQQIAELKKLLATDSQMASDPGRGRRLFDTTCASCHVLFGEGGKVGPDITGSNRADLDYILENVVDPSAVLGKDYRMSVIVTVDGRVVSGIVQQETDSALTVRTINDTVIVPKDDIEEINVSDLSLMPEKLLEPFNEQQIRDLVAYLASPTQVAPKGSPAPIDPTAGKVPDALEGESLTVANKTAGDAIPQDMRAFRRDQWSGGSQLWWTGAEPGATLDLILPVEKDGLYTLELVMTKARDYGVVKLLLDDEPLIPTLDLYNAPDVITTGVLDFAPRQLTAGEHTLRVEILGAHPQAVKAHMFGLDYVRLVPAELVDVPAIEAEAR